ncbi:YdcF family protein [Deferribacterales bacterium Es71-Z0220]|uniref:YdcF family protein n=1 Tax=Deferrivibrio essentukiensis TaxID=2880922 RepID=UPI001F602E49|nr:YdcF family protein [Deferrivibrio essentukiensis]MCB4205500.1 YdcF family protein [Deferrivibrio essentukiensis]
MIFFAIKKILSFLLLPPGLFVVLLLVVGVYLLLRKNKPVGVLLLILSTLIYLLSIEPVKDRLLLPLEDMHPVFTSSDNISKSLIVVLGGGVYDKSPDNDLKASVMPDPLKRLIYAYFLFKDNNADILVSGGRVFKSSEIQSEAEAMRDVLLRLGVDRDRIILDTNSLDTYENILNTKSIVLNNDYDRVIIVTSAYHMPRAMFLSQKAGLDAIPAPTDFKTDRTGYSFDSFLPKMGYLYESYKALHEYLGLLFYKIKY